MPLQGEYEPSSSSWVREQVEEYERSGGTRGTTLRGVPVVVITSRGGERPPGHAFESAIGALAAAEAWFVEHTPLFGGQVSGITQDGFHASDAEVLALGIFPFKKSVRYERQEIPFA